MADPNEEGVKQGQIASEKVFRRQALFYKINELVGLGPGPEPFPNPLHIFREASFGLIAYDSKIEKAVLIPDGALPVIDAANATFTLAAYPGGAVLLTFTPSADFVAFTPIDMGLAEYDAPEGTVVSCVVSKTGAGVNLPSCLLVVTYRQK